MYYTVEHPDGANTCFDQCVATSPYMEPGTWTDHGSMNIPVPPLELSSDGSYRPPYVRLDGNLLVDSYDPQGISAVKYMVFGKFPYFIGGNHERMLTIAQDRISSVSMAWRYPTTCSP